MNNGYNPQQQPPQQQQSQQQGQPQYPPQYQSYPKPPSILDKMYGRRTDLLQTLMTFFSVFMLILAPVAFLYNFIWGIVRAAGTFGDFSTFVSFFAEGVSSFAVFATLGLILGGLKRLISK